MRLTRTMLDEATADGVLGASQSDALWQFLLDREGRIGTDTPSFKPAHILYYLGGLIAIGAMTLFMTLGWEQFGDSGLLWISLGYGLLAFALTEYFLARRHLAIPAGITGALGVAMVPLVVYALQHVLGMWPDPGAGHASYRDYHAYIDWRWFLMELATLAVGAIALWRYRLPFMVMPVAVTLWYMSMDLAPVLLGGDSASFFSTFRKLVSLWFGLGMLVVALVVDYRSRHTKDFAFWLYLFGTLAFWGGLTALDSNSEFGKLGYCAINLAMIAIGAGLARRVFAVFGGLGVAFYLGHLSHTVFKDSLLFPVALTAIGLGLVAVGIQWQRHERAIGEALRSLLPAPLQEMVARRSA